MRLERWLLILALSLMALWAGGFTAAVLRDNQLPGDMAFGAMLAVLLPVLVTTPVLALLMWSLLRAMSDDDEHRPLPS